LKKVSKIYLKSVSVECNSLKIISSLLFIPFLEIKKGRETGFKEKRTSKRKRK